MIETRPWGRFEVIYADEHTWFKKLHIAPRASLSLQTHQGRTEFWWAPHEGPRVQVEDFDHALSPINTPYAVRPGTKHRLYNPCATEVLVLEWAIGSPDESDIERISDIYGR